MKESVFDILGPVMIGPSSSHTAGAARIARLAALLAGDFSKARCVLHGSFAATGKGHGTDIAITAGLLGISESDERLKSAPRLAKEAGREITFETADLGDVHDNTVRIYFDTPDGTHTVTGSSMGGGSIMLMEYDGFDIHLSGEYPALVITHYDKRGVIAEVSGVLAEFGVNIGAMEVSRQQRGELASMTIQCDGDVPQGAVEDIKMMKEIVRVRSLPKL